MAGFFATILGYTPSLLLRMDEDSGVLSDTSGNTNHATVSGSSLTYRDTGPDATGAPYAVTFASGTLATITDHTTIDLGNGPFTIGFVLKRTAASTDYNFATKSSAYSVGITSDLMRLRDAAGLTNIRSTPADTDTGWHHWILTRGSAVDGKVWRDGVDVTVNSNTVTFADSSGNLVLGTDFVGSMAAFFIVKGTALDAAAVAAIYAARSTADTSTTASAEVATAVAAAEF